MDVIGPMLRQKLSEHSMKRRRISNGLRGDRERLELLLQVKGFEDRS